MNPRKCDVIIYAEDDIDLGLHFAKDITVNGERLWIPEDAEITVAYGGRGEPTRVTITMLASSVRTETVHPRTEVAS